MCRTPWAAYLWPGLPQLWSSGDWSGLFFGCGFAVLVNLALAATLVWSELLTPGVRNLVWLAVGVFWVASTVFSYRHRQFRGTPESGCSEQHFRRALGHYLKGNWFEAEHVLVKMLCDDPRDGDAGLLLATLLRHANRSGEALACLERIERLESAERWRPEIRRERQLLESPQTQPESSHGPSHGVVETDDKEAGLLDAA